MLVSVRLLVFELGARTGRTDEQTDGRTSGTRNAMTIGAVCRATNAAENK